MGSASVWDAAARAKRVEAVETPPAPKASAPVELELLIAGVVQVTLAKELPAWDPERRAALAHELRQRLLALFAAEVRPAPIHLAPEPPRPAPTPVAPEPVVPSFRGPADAVAQDTCADPQLGTPLAHLLEERLGRLGGPLDERGELRVLLVRLALRAQAFSVEGPQASPEERLRLDILQRRASKLERGLQDVRSALSYVAGLARVDAGLASIYRAVQGLSEDAPDRERKRSLLESLFQANLVLQKPDTARA